MSPQRRRKLDSHTDSIMQTYNSFLSNSKIGEDGNAYSESLIPAKRSRPSWTTTKRIGPGRRLGLVKDTVGRQPKEGAPSLGVLVRRFLNVYLDELSYETLEHVPWKLIKPVWEDALITNFSVDKIVSKLGRRSPVCMGYDFSIPGVEPDVDHRKDEPDFHCCPLGQHKALRQGGRLRKDEVAGRAPMQGERLRKDEVAGRAPMQGERLRRDQVPGYEPIAPLLSAISSQTCKWLVILELHPYSGCTRFDLLEIANIPNLGALDVSHVDGLEIDDGIIHAWSRAASQQGKLQKLKVLQMKGHQSISINALKSLACIESLLIVNISECRIERKDFHEAKRLGWTATDPELNDDLSPELMLHQLRDDEAVGVERLVAHIKMGACSFIYFGRPAVFRRARMFDRSLKRSEHPGAEAANDGEGSLKKQRTVRERKRKDVGDLLSEFGMGGGKGKSK
ncbi:hypothetical protein RUND412_003485 [Rhizina undulata]